MSLMRLQKFLSLAGSCSRRRGEEYIQHGRVRVNGQIVTVLGTKVDSDTDQIELDGHPLQLQREKIYIALNKPVGYVSTCEQPGDKIVLDLIPIRERIYPIGRLDKDSTGLLLFTNDGDLHLRLSHPSYDHEKEYEVSTRNPLPDGALNHLAKGLHIMGEKTRPAKVKKLSPTVFRMILKEGKNRQIRRMVAKVGGHVIALRRIRIADIHLGELAQGQWRYLTDKEKQSLLLPVH